MLSPGVKRISSFITVKYPNNAKLKATWNKLKILIKGYFDFLIKIIFKQFREFRSLSCIFFTISHNYDIFS